MGLERILDCNIRFLPSERNFRKLFHTNFISQMEAGGSASLIKKKMLVFICIWYNVNVPTQLLVDQFTCDFHRQFSQYCRAKSCRLYPEKWGFNRPDS